MFFEKGFDEVEKTKTTPVAMGIDSDNSVPWYNFNHKLGVKSCYHPRKRSARTSAKSE